ncbi:MAG: 4Fe-4S binding protein [Acidobacteria bacterium]|nr:4Fe-4S binding protein [Acidobacteriota bacterium]
MKRKIIRIDEELCNGCGLCVPDCPEGALQVIDGKARLVGDLLCDGLGACIGACPEGAIKIEEREAELYDERKVMENIIPQGINGIRAHCNHLRNHGQSEYLIQALACLKERNIEAGIEPAGADLPVARHQCPGSQVLAFPSARDREEGKDKRLSRLTHWPIQLHLISPGAPHYRGSDLLLAADCVAYSMADFHRDFLKDRTLAIACPKLDSNQEAYREKITALIDQAGIRSITVLIMQVPCCGALMQTVLEAAGRAERKIPIHCAVVGIRGEILREDRLAV